jgi:hypothetical protein
VNAQHPTTFLASPFFFFGSYEIPYAKISDVLEIADHAHAILGSIPLIQMVQPGTWKAVTTEAVLDFRVHNLLTVLDSTYYAGFRLEAIVTSATGAWFLISCVCAAEAAIHSTGSD